MANWNELTVGSATKSMLNLDLAYYIVPRTPKGTDIYFLLTQKNKGADYLVPEKVSVQESYEQVSRLLK